MSGRNRISPLHPDLFSITMRTNPSLLSSLFVGDVVFLFSFGECGVEFGMLYIKDKSGLVGLLLRLLPTSGPLIFKIVKIARRWSIHSSTYIWMV